MVMQSSTQTGVYCWNARVIYLYFSAVYLQTKYMITIVNITDEHKIKRKV